MAPLSTKPLTKICGLSTPETVAAAARLGTDYIGFVHFPKSPRHVELEQANALAQQNGNSLPVLLLVNPELGLIDRVIQIINPAVIQLHGDEKPEFLAEISRRHDVTLWKAVPVRTSHDILSAQIFAPLVDRILFDAKPPAGSDLPGGNGLRFDWELLKAVSINYPWGLSGGLDPDNVVEALQTTKAPLVDVSSGVEDGPGQKNVDKMAAFLNAVRAS